MSKEIFRQAVQTQHGTTVEVVCDEDGNVEVRGSCRVTVVRPDWVNGKHLDSATCAMVEVDSNSIKASLHRTGNAPGADPRRVPYVAAYLPFREGRSVTFEVSAKPDPLPFRHPVIRGVPDALVPDGAVV